METKKFGGSLKMPKPKESTPTGDESLKWLGGDKRKKPGKQIPSRVQKDFKEMAEWMKNHKA
jgi:hypothetical protein